MYTCSGSILSGLKQVQKGPEIITHYKERLVTTEELFPSVVYCDLIVQA